ncbi:MAG: PorT family protein [Bacteroidales bacterium]|nr:PorT family protein [Bacteroidales bacterium]
MRKTLLIISLVAAVSVGVYAQTGNARVGIKLGPTFDWASAGSTAADNDGFRLGASAGLVYDYYFASNFAVSSGVNFNLLRLKYTFIDRRRVEDFLEEANLPVSRRVDAYNIEVPLKFKAKVDVADSFKAYAEAGAGLSFNLKDYAKDSYTFYWVNFEGEDYVDCTNQYRPLQLSMIFGLGAEYEINRNCSAFAQLTFDHSFSNAFVRALEKQTGSILRNNFIGIEVGIMY